MTSAKSDKQLGHYLAAGRSGGLLTPDRFVAFY